MYFFVNVRCLLKRLRPLVYDLVSRGSNHTPYSNISGMRWLSGQYMGKNPRVPGLSYKTFLCALMKPAGKVCGL